MSYKDIRRQCTSVMAAAAVMASGQNIQQCMRALFTQLNFSELAYYIRIARLRRFHVRGAQYMRDAAAAPTASLIAPDTVVDDDEIDTSSSDDEAEIGGDGIDQAWS